jgi:hypothetical protein
VYSKWSLCQRHPTDEITPIALTCLPRLSLAQLRPTLRVNYRMCVPQRLEFSHFPMGKLLTCLP